MTQIQNPKQNRFSHLKIGNWNLFGIWNLALGI
jgi:hypothetical protein